MDKINDMSTTQLKIMTSGKEYFLKYGFKNSPLRNIVKDAGFTLGAFYGYYKTKEDLFYALTDDVANGFKNIILSVREDMNKLPENERIFSMLDCYLVRLHEMVDYICENKIEMVLLLKCSDGTKYENFTKYFRTETSSLISDSAKVSNEQTLSINPVFVNMLMCGYFDMLSRIIVEIDDKDEMYTLIRDVALVYKNGMLSVMNGEV